MRKMVVLVMLASLVRVAEAGEFRAALIYGVGGATFEDKVGGELTTESSRVSLGGIYYLDEAAPFFGLALGRAKVGDLEINGIPLGFPDQETDVRSFTAGYRGGQYSALQPIVAATFQRAEYENGDNEDFTSFLVGLEKSTQGGRYELTAGYTTGDDADSFGIGVAGVIFANEWLGFGASTGYSAGDGKVLGIDVDTSSWSVGVGIEVRFMN